MTLRFYGTCVNCRIVHFGRLLRHTGYRWMSTPGTRKANSSGGLFTTGSVCGRCLVPAPGIPPFAGSPGVRSGVSAGSRAVAHGAGRGGGTLRFGRHGQYPRQFGVGLVAAFAPVHAGLRVDQTLPTVRWVSPGGVTRPCWVASVNSRRLSQTHPMGDAAKTPFTLRQAQAERGFCCAN